MLPMYTYQIVWWRKVAQIYQTKGGGHNLPNALLLEKST